MPHVRPNSVGPHDVKKDQQDPKAKGVRPETAYNTEVSEQAKIVGPSTAKKKE